MKNYRIGKPLLEKISMFKYMSKKQINYIAYNMNSLKYLSQEEIFKEGDDANSFFIIVDGEIQIKIKGKEPIILRKGDSFGENSFKKGQVRGGTAIAHGKASAKLLSIGRKDLQNILDEQIEELLAFNTLRWALKRSKYFNQIPTDLLRKILNIGKIIEFNDKEVIIKEN